MNEEILKSIRSIILQYLMLYYGCEAMSKHMYVTEIIMSAIKNELENISET